MSSYISWIQRVVQGRQLFAIRRANEETFLHLDNLLEGDNSTDFTDTEATFIEEPFSLDSILIKSGNSTYEDAYLDEKFL